MKIEQLNVYHGIKDTFAYVATAIENNGMYYYRANNVTLEIEQREYAFVTKNPNLYYCSTALKLNLKIMRIADINHLISNSRE